MPFPAPSRRRPGTMPPCPARRQSGITLLEVSLAIAVSGALAIGLLKMQQFQQMVTAGRHTGERLASLLDGALRYAREHGDALARVSHQAPCAEVRLSQSASVATSSAPSLPAGCGLTVAGRTLANALQPTIEDLRALGYVTLDDTLPLPHGNTVIDGRTGAAAAARWAVSIQCIRHCGNAGTGSSADADAGAQADAKENAERKPSLSVMLYNTQPFYPSGDLPFGAGAQFKAMTQALGHLGWLSLPREAPRQAHRLRGQGAPVDNPLRGDDAKDGVAGVLAARALVHLGASPATAGGPDRCTDLPGTMCQDGTTRPTARWDFNGQDLANVRALEVRGEAVAHDAVVHRQLRVGQWGRPAELATFGKTVVKQGTLSVENGFADFSYDAGNTLQGGIRLPTRKKPGTPCNFSGNDRLKHGGNVGLYFDGNAMHLVVCRPRVEEILVTTEDGFFSHKRGTRIRQQFLEGIWTHSGDTAPLPPLDPNRSWQ